MFSTYAEAKTWIDEGQRKYGKIAFTARPEYADNYEDIQKLWKIENPDYKRPNRKTAKHVGPHAANLLTHSLNGTQNIKETT